MSNYRSRHLMRVHQVLGIRRTPIYEEILLEVIWRIVDEQVTFRVAQMVYTVADAITELPDIGQGGVRAVTISEIKGWVNVTESVVEVDTRRMADLRIWIESLADHLEVSEDYRHQRIGRMCPDGGCRMRLYLFKDLDRWAKLPYINSALKQGEHLVEQTR